MSLPVAIRDCEAARERIAGFAKHTPVLRAEGLDRYVGAEVYVKAECLQVTGAFKVRGAANKILSLSREERARGIIAASSGNHAQGVAYVCQKLGIHPILVLPENAPEVKVRNSRAMGAQVIQYGTTSAERYARLNELVEQNGYSVIHTYNDPLVIAGQGTLGLEIMEDLPEVDAVMIPCGGGGLTSGIALAVKDRKPSVRVVSVEPASGPKYSESRKAGRKVEVPIRDGLVSSLNLSYPGENPYLMIEALVDEMIAVEDEPLKLALALLMRHVKLAVEPAAAMPLAAVLSGKTKVRRSEKVLFVLSGGNVDLPKLASLVTSVDSREYE